MNKTLVFSVVVVIAVCGGLILWQYAEGEDLSCESIEKGKQESISYNANQVINIIKQEYPHMNTDPEYKLWSAEYFDESAWFVTRAMIDLNKPVLYVGNTGGPGYYTERKYWVWWFYETTKEIDGPWLVPPQELFDKMGKLPYYDKGGLPRF